MTDALSGGSFKLGTALATVILTILALWLVGSTADVFLLLFVAIIISLYLGAVRLKSVEEAQGDIVRVIRALEEAGQIVINRGAGGDEYVV